MKYIFCNISLSYNSVLLSHKNGNQPRQVDIHGIPILTGIFIFFVCTFFFKIIAKVAKVDNIDPTDVRSNSSTSGKRKV